MTDGLDYDGYPLPETLEKLTEWDPADFQGLTKFLQDNWKYKDYIEISESGNTVWISTGGWSGHEEMIGAINPMWMLIHHYQWRRGGHYIFTYQGGEPRAK